MPWFRIDDGFHSHPKVLAVSLAARGLWATAGSWSSAHLTDGFIRDRDVAALGGSPELAEELVTEGLWRRRKGGYQFHQWDERNPTRKAVENERKQKAERQKRWREKKSRRVTNPSVDASEDALVTPAPTRPAPKEAGRSGTDPARPSRASEPEARPSGPRPENQPVAEALRRNIPPGYQPVPPEESARRAAALRQALQARNG